VLFGLTLIAGGFMQMRWKELTAARSQVLLDSYLLGYIGLWFGLSVLGAIHECFHGLAGLRYGLVAKRLNGALYLGFIPYIFITIPGIYTIKPRQRLVLWAAGIYSNLLIGGVLALINSSLLPGSLASQFLSKLIVANLILVVFNLSPFMATDAYFIVSTLFKTPNVRTNSYEEFKKWVKGEKNGFGPFLAVYFALSVLLIVYLLFQMVGWVIALVTQSLRFGMTMALLVQSSPLLLIIAGLVAKTLWHHKSRSPDEQEGNQGSV
jgi:putative peptide zinc metalloprotease protein